MFLRMQALAGSQTIKPPDLTSLGVFGIGQGGPSRAPASSDPAVSKQQYLGPPQLVPS